MNRFTTLSPSSTTPASLWLEALPLSQTAIGLVSLPLIGGTAGIALGLVRGDVQAARGELRAVREEMSRV